MDNLAKEYIIDFYSRKLSFFGNMPAAVGWTQTGQRLRYECILKLINPAGKSILDFGCGKGDLYGFLKEKGINTKYTGIDLNNNLINTAKAVYPEGEFIALDLDSNQLLGYYDYVILCGVFNLNIDGVRESIIKYLSKLFAHTNKKLVFNCLSSFSKTKDINLIYLDPAEILTAGLDIAKSVELRHDLIEGDIFLILNKDYKIK